MLGACGQWALTAVPGADTLGDTGPAYRLQYRPLTSGLPGSEALLYLKPGSDTPSWIERLDLHGDPLRTLRILETGTLGDHVGIRRALIERPSGRILLEVRSAQIGGPPLDPLRGD